MASPEILTFSPVRRLDLSKIPKSSDVNLGIITPKTNKMASPEVLTYSPVRYLDLSKILKSSDVDLGIITPKTNTESTYSFRSNNSDFSSEVFELENND